RYYDESVETAAPAELRRLQERRPRAQLLYANEHSPMIRDKLKAAGARPEDVRTLENLARPPFTPKEALRARQAQSPPFGRHVAARTGIVRVHASSGTTGTPSYVGITEHDRQTWIEAVCRAYWAQGLRPEHALTMGIGIGFFVGGLPIAEAAER